MCYENSRRRLLLWREWAIIHPKLLNKNLRLQNLIIHKKGPVDIKLYLNPVLSKEEWYKEVVWW